MSVQVEKLENNKAKMTIEVPAEVFDKAVKAAYEKNKNKFQIPGFRKGKTPQAMIEKMYGVGVFYEDAANAVMEAEYPKAYEESGLDIVSSPEVDVIQIGKGQNFIFTAEVFLKPEVKLGAYKNIEVDKIEVAVTDEEVEADLAQQQKNNARQVPVTDRAVVDGDIVTIDFEGFVDGVAFEGGKGTDYALTIGSHSFIDTFEEQLIGKNIGEECEVNVTFPEQYQAAELAGKPAMFKVTVKEIKAEELPELDDDFASDVSEYETLDEYKASIRKNLEEKKAEDAKNAKADAAMQAVIANAEMDIPDVMVSNMQRQMVDEFAQNITMQGISMDQYMQFTGMTMEKLLESCKPQALARVQSRLVLEAIVKAEGLTATEEEYEAELKTMADVYQMEVDKVKEIIEANGKAQLMEDLAIQKASKLVVDSAVEK